MTHRLPHLFAFVMLLLIGTILLPNTAHAADPVTCSASISTIDFGNIDPTSTSNTDVTPTLSWSCTSNVNTNYSATICLNIANGPLGLNGGMRQISGPGGNLGFQIYSNAPGGTIWGSVDTPAYPNVVFRTFSIPKRTTQSGTIPVYARLFGSQNFATAGTYASTFATPNVRITGILDGNGNASDCSSAGEDAGNFSPVTITAAIIKMCSVSASNMDFGTPTGVLAANVDTTSALSVQCTKSVAYNIGLDNGSHANGTIRRMQGPGGFIAYDLYRDSGRAQRWGNTIGTNTVTGTGSGLSQNSTVYGRVAPQSTPSAGTYNDTINVTVTY